MAVEITMPQLGLTMTEGTVTRWFKQKGEAVKVGELLFEVATDKITNQVEATAAGTVLEIRVAEGKVAPVKAVVAIIGVDGEIVVARLAKNERPTTSSLIPELNSENSAAFSVTTTQSTINEGDRWVKASPAARKLAKELGVDLALVTATGPDGMVVEKNILLFVEKRTSLPKTSPMAAKLAAEHGVSLSTMAGEGRIMKADVVAAMKKDVSTQPIIGMRKVIAERMSLSWQTAPHVHLTVDVDMTEAITLKDKIASVTGQKASITEIVVKCAAQVLREIPTVNASVVDNRIVFHENVNVGMAVALDNGLIVPVIFDADRKSIREIREAVVDLGTRARTGQLKPDEISGGTFTVTNLGMFGTDHFTPIINPPESAILGVCRTVEKPVVWQGTVVVRPMCNFVLGFDHRIIDGAVGARFMARVRELIENPVLMLVG